MVQRGPRGVRAKFADAAAELVREQAIEDPTPLLPREGFDAGKWDGAPFDKLPPGCPVVPLGVDHKTSFFICSMGQLLSFEGLKEDGLIKLFRATPNYLYWAWPRWGQPKSDGDGERPRPKINGMEVKKAIACLEKECARRGLFDPRNRVRGRGAWTDRAGRLIWHAGESLWRVDGDKLKQAPPGEIDGVFYPRRATIMSPWPEPVAPDDSPARGIFDMLKTWTWERPLLDPLIVLGGIGVMLIGGALTHRPHIAAMGDFGTGKSALQDLVKGIVGSALIRAENATEAGVRQHMGLDALPVALDEFEAKDDNRRAMALIELARVSYSGGTVLRGGQDHKGVEFIARNTFFCSGINMPPMMAQDRSRFAVLNLGKIKVGQAPPPVIQDEWGRMLLRALMDGWDKFNVAKADWRGVLGNAGLSGRGQDTYGTLFAIAQVLLGIADMEDIGLPVTEAERLGQMIADATADERAEQLENWRDAYEHIVASPLDMMHGGQRISLGQALDEMNAPSGAGLEEQRAIDAARLAGCKLIGEADAAAPHGKKRWLLAVPPKGPFIARLFNDHKLKMGGWFAALKQAPPNVVIRDRGNGQVHKINGSVERCLLVDIAAYDDFCKQREI